MASCQSKLPVWPNTVLLVVSWRLGSNRKLFHPTPSVHVARQPVSARASSRTSRSVYAPRSAPSVNSSITSRA